MEASVGVEIETPPLICSQRLLNLKSDKIQHQKFLWGRNYQSKNLLQFLISLTFLFASLYCLLLIIYCIVQLMSEIQYWCTVYVNALRYGSLVCMVTQHNTTHLQSNKNTTSRAETEQQDTAWLKCPESLVPKNHPLLFMLFFVLGVDSTKAFVVSVHMYFSI